MEDFALFITWVGAAFILMFHIGLSYISSYLKPYMPILICSSSDKWDYSRVVVSHEVWLNLDSFPRSLEPCFFQLHFHRALLWLFSESGLLCFVLINIHWFLNMLGLAYLSVKQNIYVLLIVYHFGEYA